MRKTMKAEIRRDIGIFVALCLICLAVSLSSCANTSAPGDTATPNVPSIPVDDVLPTPTPENSIGVMVLDTGIHPDDDIKPYLSTTNTAAELEDIHGHGTHIAGIILFGKKLNDPLCEEVKLYSCKYYMPEVTSVHRCLELASELELDFINFSGGGYKYDEVEAMLILKFKGVVVAAAGNYEIDEETGKRITHDLKKKPYYPGSLDYENIVVVGNGKSEKKRSKSSNYGLPKMIWRDGENITSYYPKSRRGIMSGTSQAAAIYTHELLKAKCQRLRSDK